MSAETTQTPAPRFVWWCRETELGMIISRVLLVRDFPDANVACIECTSGVRPIVGYGDLASTPARAAAKVAPHLEALEEAECFDVSPWVRRIKLSEEMRTCTNNGGNIAISRQTAAPTVAGTTA